MLARDGQVAMIGSAPDTGALMTRYASSLERIGPVRERGGEARPPMDLSLVGSLLRGRDQRGSIVLRPQQPKVQEKIHAG